MIREPTAESAQWQEHDADVYGALGMGAMPADETLALNAAKSYRQKASCF